MTRVAVFDLDGTLVDTPRAIVETFSATFAATGVPPAAAQATRATIGLPLEQAFGKLMGVALDDSRVAECVRQYQVLFRELVLPRAAELVFPGVADGLTALADHGFGLAVATSKFYASADALLAAAGLRDRFDVVVGADQVAKPKPDPESIRLVMRKTRASAPNTVMVGDTTHDLLMAKSVGVRSVAVTYGVHTLAELNSASPTWTADTFDEVVDCIRTGYRATDG